MSTGPGEQDGVQWLTSGMPPGFQLFFTIIIVGIISMIGYAVIGGLRTWSANNAVELLTRTCTIVAKRTKVSGGSGDTSASTSYFVTFEFDDRSRTELLVNGQQYGLLAEGDYGELTYQGTRYKGFRRL